MVLAEAEKNEISDMVKKESHEGSLCKEVPRGLFLIQYAHFMRYVRCCLLLLSGPGFSGR